MNLHKLTKIAAIVIAVLSLIFLGGLMASSNAAADNGWISPLIYLSYFVLFLCVAIVLVYVFKNLFSNKENLKRTLMSLGMFLGVMLISYILADGSDVQANKIVYSGSTPKLVGAGIFSIYILGLVAIVAMMWSTISKFKK